jgi:hypothetical protein
MGHVKIEGDEQNRSKHVMSSSNGGEYEDDCLLGCLAV